MPIARISLKNLDIGFWSLFGYWCLPCTILGAGLGIWWFLRSSNLLRTLILETKSSRREDSNQIIIESKEHQEDDEDQTNLLSDFHFFDTDGPSQNRLQS